MKEIGYTLKQYIWDNYRNGYSIGRIAKALRLSKSTVHKYIKRLPQTTREEHDKNKKYNYK